MSPTHLAAALLMVTIWGFNFIVIRWGLNDVPPLTLTFLALRFGCVSGGSVSCDGRSRHGAW